MDWQTGELGFNSQQDQEISHLQSVQTGFGAQQASYLTGTVGVSAGVK
jgi:hypothetical protein